MSEQKVNTKDSVSSVSDASAKKYAEQLKRAKAKFDKEKKVKRSIPKNAARYLGNTVFVSVNGVAVNLPVDGKQYEIPETLADHLDQMLSQVTM